MEALGAVSSVFAVASLALQLSSSIQELVEFWDLVKEAPDEIAQIKTQLRVLGRLLRCIEAEIEGATNDIGIQCLQVCEASILKLERVSKELDIGLNGNGVRRRWTCLRKALRERELASYRNEIEYAKSMLIMYQGWRNGQRYHSLVTMISKITPRLTERTSIANPIKYLEALDIRQLRRDSSELTKVFLGSTIYEIHLSFGTFRMRTLTHVTKPKGFQLNGLGLTQNQKQQETTLSFVPSRFLSSIFEWSLTRGYCSQMTLKCFNVRPGWSPIFKHAAEGDMQKVQELFEKGQASPDDVDEDGWTLLHYASSCHQAEMCYMLLDLGAASNPVTTRLETPLLLASKRRHLAVGYGKYRQRKQESSINTIRALVQRGRNDPMQTDDIGYTSVLTSSGDPKNDILPFLLNQDDYEIDLAYRTPTGHSTVAYISTREDFPELMQPLLKRGINVNDPCAKSWCYRGAWLACIGAPSMIHYTVWVWYGRLLGMSDTHFPWGRDSVPVHPLKTIQSLLDYGADLHARTTSGHTILDGLLLNLLQFDGWARPQIVRTSCFKEWLDIVQQLGFDIREYIRCERVIHKGDCHELGLGLTMELRFNDDAAPWAWSVFQGPEERERGEFVDHITKCCIWPEWQRRFAAPKSLPPCPPTLLIRNPNAMVVLQSLETPQDARDISTSETNDYPPRMLSLLRSYIPRIVWKARRYAILGSQYRLEFSLYFAFTISLLGLGYFARIWVTWVFYLSLKLAGYAISL